MKISKIRKYKNNNKNNKKRTKSKIRLIKKKDYISNSIPLHPLSPEIKTIELMITPLQRLQETDLSNHK